MQKPIESLYLVGILFIIAGVFTPWYCTDAFLSYCFPGLIVNPGILQFIERDSLVMTLIVVVIGAIIVYTAVSIRPWRLDIALAIAFAALLYLSINRGLLVDNGGLIIGLLGVLALWCSYRADQLGRYATRLTLVTTALLTIRVFTHFSGLLLLKISGGFVSDDISLQSGAVLVIVGTLLTVGISVLRYRIVRRQTA